MQKLTALYQKFEKLVSGVKFAAFIITVFAIALVVGTFQESYHGADYANRIVYKAWWFMGIEILMFLSIFMAVVVRLPPKKRLYGFYTIHAGLMILFIGSLFTYINGVDGSIQLLPNTPAKRIFVNEDYLKINFSKNRELHKLALPYSASETDINKEIQGIKIKKFIPFAKKEITWVPNLSEDVHSGQYLIFNDNVSEEFTLSLEPNSDFKSTLSIGLLSLHYMPSILEDCLTKPSASGFIIWNLKSKSCTTAEEGNLKINKTPSGTRFINFEHEGESLTFFPDFSPVAINKNRTKNLESPFRVLSLELFRKKANLFIFGESVSYFSKRKNAWLLKKFSDFDDGLIPLPWMSFKLRNMKYSDSEYPIEIPVAMKPIQENGKIIAGDIKAVNIEYNNKSFWVRTDAPLEISNSKETIKFQILPKELVLPYQITLERFQMNKDPGTDTPASFESFV